MSPNRFVFLNSILQKIILLISLSSICSIVSAENISNSWFVGVGVGVTDLDYEYPDRSTFKEQSGSLMLSAGYRFSNYFSLELSFFDIESAQDDVELEVSLGSNVITDDQIDLELVSFAAVGRLPIGESVNVVGKLAIANWQTRETIQGASDNDSGTQLMPSVGIEFTVNQSISINGSVSYLSIEPSHFNNDTSLDLDIWSLGAIYSF